MQQPGQPSPPKHPVINNLKRNGGHITPPLYQDYSDLKAAHGLSMAKAIIRFRLAHLPELIRVAKEEDLLETSQCREVETYDVFFEQGLFEISKEKLRTYLDDNPEETENWAVLESTAHLQVRSG